MIKHFSFSNFDQNEVLKLTSIRDGESKIGQNIQTRPLAPEVEYVILGVEESIGPRANYGVSGAEHGFKAFLKRFLNMQSNRFLTGKNIALAGRIHSHSAFTTVEAARSTISELDHLISEILTPFFKANKKVIVIGGGHNNAFPLMKSLFDATNQKVSVINLDPHADCRALEGRHSGNPFSYGMEHGLLEKYTVLGLHKAYNNEFLLQYLEKNNCDFTFFDDYAHGIQSLESDIISTKIKHENTPFVGLELDLDAIKGMPSSAFTPSGVTTEEARNYIFQLSSLKNVYYLHLPEAAPVTETDQLVVGKTLAYLVWDFILANQQKTIK